MSASWPPDFKKYESLSNDELVNAITSESQNKQAPANYTQFFDQLSKYIYIQGERLKKQQTSNENHTHSMQIAEANYNTLTELYKEEHERCLDLEERALNERLKYNSELQQAKELLENNLNTEKQEHEKTKEKHAIMRMKMEQEFVQTMKEAQELRQKLQEAESKIQSLETSIAEKTSAQQNISQQQQQQQQQQQHYYQTQQQQQDRNVVAVNGVSGGVVAAGANIPVGYNGNNNADLEYFLRYFQNPNQQQQQ